MMATLVAAVGIAGVAGLFVTTARVASVAELHSAANDLARSELETILSFDYELIGISPKAEGFAPIIDDLTTVTVLEGSLIEPVQKLEIDGAIFVVQRSVTWVTVGDDREAYKLVEIEIEFETPTGTQRVVVQTGVHQGSRGG